MGKILHSQKRETNTHKTQTESRDLRNVLDPHLFTSAHVFVEMSSFFVAQFDRLSQMRIVFSNERPTPCTTLH